MGRRIWQTLEFSRDARDAAMAIQAELGLPPLVARVLSLRGIRDPRSAREFLAADLRDLADPCLLPDMDKAVQRVLRAVREHEKIRIYGDYDVDGVTSVCLLLHVLGALGADVDYYIPDRLVEGYGVNPEAIEKAAESGVSLLITVDCGITACEEVELAREHGVDVIITDHHEPGEKLPRACAAINPKRRGSRYPFADLAGVGVAYKLGRALVAAESGTLDALEHPADMLELVALGTVADVAPLTGENRVLVRHGLAGLNSTGNIGIRALLETTGLLGREIGAGSIGFMLAPRLNAAGRLGDASLSVELLTTACARRAAEIASRLDGANRERQSIEQCILDEAASMVETVDGEATDSVLVIAGEGWHAGVIGIVASRLADRFYRPTILITLDGEEGRGSGRSIEPFDLYGGLSRCADLLEGFGGHRHAAGISIRREAVDAFRARLNEVGRDLLTEDDLIPRVTCDFETGFEAFDCACAEGLAALAPFGAGNPTPTFLTRGVRLVEYRGVGSGARHLKMKLRHNGTTLDAIGFGLGTMAPTLFSRHVTEVDAIYAVGINHWNGTRRVELNVKALREAVNG